ncbi:hypothetical protein D3C81_2027680 [compost metagenome]
MQHDVFRNSCISSLYKLLGNGAYTACIPLFREEASRITFSDPGIYAGNKIDIFIHCCVSFVGCSIVCNWSAQLLFFCNNIDGMVG